MNDSRPVRQRRVLVVDDNRLLAVNEQAILRRAECLSDLAGSVADACRLVSRNRYDLIILDHHLTDGLGTDILAYMDAHGLRVPVLYSTGDRTAELDGVTALPLVHGLLYKPFTPGELLAQTELCCPAHRVDAAPICPDQSMLAAPSKAVG